MGHTPSLTLTLALALSHYICAWPPLDLCHCSVDFYVIDEVRQFPLKPDGCPGLGTCLRMQRLGRQLNRRRRASKATAVCIAVVCACLSLLCCALLMGSGRDAAADSAAPPVSCALPRRSFEPLGTFPFWGRMMNASWPCPAAGMNNQLMLIMGKLHCFALNETRQRGPRGGAAPVAHFLWKDITCSPTGGREGRRRYAVGGGDYRYAWFRWSELLEFSDVDVPRGDTGGRLVARVCLADAHSWSEQPWLARCPASVDGLWGTGAYWALRRALRLRAWFDRAAAAFFARRGIARVPGTRGAHAAVALHVRRGDYQNFCRENAHGRGRHKYRVAPFVALKRQRHPNVTIRAADFWGACYPALSDIVAAVAETAAAQRNIRDVLLMTNAPSFRRELTDALRARDDTRHLTLHAFVAADEEHSEGEVPPPYWPRRSGAARLFTAAESAWMDMNLISMAHVMILNRYSTFSHSALDLHILREGRLAAQLQWW